MVSPCGDDFFVGATFGRPHGLYKFKPCRFQKRAVEGASPYRLLGKVRCAAKSLRSLRIYICSGRGWAVQILCSDMGFVWYMALVCFLHFNLHLKLRSGLCPKNPQGTLSLDPASPLTPGLSLRFISRYARCCFLLYACSFLWSALLIPHSSLLTLLALPLDETTVK